MSRLDLALITVTAILAGLAFVQPARWLVSVWLSDPYYSHGFLIPPIAAGLAWHLRHQIKVLPTTPSAWGLGLFGATLAGAVLAISWQAYFVTILTVPILIGALVLYLKGPGALRLLLFPIGYLGLMIPLPVVDSLAFQLQLWVSAFATTVARLLAVPAHQEGAAVSVPGAAYVVGLACSGLSSIIALLALGTLLVYLLDGQLWARLLLVLAIVPIAVLANGLRVSSLLWVAYHFGGDAGLAYHDTVAGYLSWAMAIGCLILSSRVLRCRLSLVGSR
jgi:exosortase